MDAAIAFKALYTDEGRRDPYPHYAELHRHGPALRLGPEVGRYAAVVHGYEAVNQALRDPVFRVVDAGRLDKLEPSWRDHPAMRTFMDSMFFTNGPGHSRMRRLFSQMFTARRVAALEPAVVRLTCAALDRLAALGAGGAPVDFMGEFACRVPSDVIGELIGIPEEDRGWFLPRVRAVGRVLELNGRTADNVRIGNGAAEEVTAYFADLLARRRAAPRQDMVSALVQADGGPGDDLTDAELMFNLMALFNAGFVTTTNLLGNGLTLLLERPDDLAAVRTRPDLVPGYVEEILRYEPSSHFVTRWVAADADVAGIPVPSGGSVLVLLGAANRDPARFPDPDVFDATRPDIQPMTFGAGPHYCLGAALSRTEARIALPLLLNRFPRIALAGPPGERNQLAMRGYATLPVTLGV